MGSIVQTRLDGRQCRLAGLPRPAGGFRPRRRAAGRRPSTAVARSGSNVAPGDRVAIATADSPAFFATFAAALASGFTAVVIDPLAAGDEIRRMLARSRPAAAIADDAVAERRLTAAGHPITSPTVLVARDRRDRP